LLAGHPLVSRRKPFLQERGRWFPGTRWGRASSRSERIRGKPILWKKAPATRQSTLRTFGTTRCLLSERLSPRPLAPPVAWAPMVRLAGLAPTFLLTAPSRHKFGTALAPAKKGSAEPAMIRPEAGERGGGG